MNKFTTIKARRFLLVLSCCLLVAVISSIFLYLSFYLSQYQSNDPKPENNNRNLWFCEDENKCFNLKILKKKYIDKNNKSPRLLIAKHYLDKLDATRKDVRHRAEKVKNRIILEESDKYYVPALFIAEEKIYKVMIKFRGHDFESRVDSPLSFKVSIKDKTNTHFMGMREFTIEDVKERGGSFGIFIQKILESESSYAPRYFTMDTFLNDKLIKDIVYFDSFGKENQEYNKRPESFIFKNSADFNLFQRSQYAKFISNNPKSKSKLVYASGDYIDTSDPGRKNKSPILKKKYEDGYKLLFSYLKGYTTFEEVFSVKSFIPHLFFSELLCEPHGFISNNIFFYYNPIIRKLEAIVFDRTSTYSSKLYNQKMRNCNVKSFPIPKIYISVKENFEKEYKDYAKRFLHQFVHGDLRNKKWRIEKEVNDKKIMSNRFIIKRASYLANEKYDYKYKDLIKKRRSANIDTSKIRLIEPQDYLISYPLFIYVADSGNFTYKITVQNNLKTDVFLKNIYYFNKNGKKQFIISGDKRIVPKKRIGQLETLLKASKKKINISKLFYDAYYFNDNGKRFEINKNPVFTHVAPYRSKNDLKFQGYNVDKTIKKFKFIKVDKASKTMKIVDGNYTIKKDLIIPEGYSLEIKNSKLKFAPGTRIVTRESALKISNSTLKPINEKKGWSGLVVLQSKNKSYITDTKISGIKYPNGNILDDEWSLTGAVTFYESDVDITRSEFRENNTEDLLNIVRSKFLIQDSLMSDTPSDAFDSDFSEGKILNTDFRNTKGDAVDMSGSQIKMIGGVISGAFDKALSIGEGSNFYGKNIKVENSGSGFVVKDSSKGLIDNCSFNNIEGVAYMSFIKKDEYGPAALKVRKSSVTNSDTLYEVSQPSTLFIDGKEMKDKGTDLKSLYEQGRFKKIQW